MKNGNRKKELSGSKNKLAPLSIVGLVEKYNISTSFIVCHVTLNFFVDVYLDATHVLYVSEWRRKNEGEEAVEIELEEVRNKRIFLL